MIVQLHDNDNDGDSDDHDGDIAAAAKSYCSLLVKQFQVLSPCQEPGIA